VTALSRAELSYSFCQSMKLEWRLWTFIVVKVCQRAFDREVLKYA